MKKSSIPALFHVIQVLTSVFGILKIALVPSLSHAFDATALPHPNSLSSSSCDYDTSAAGAGEGAGEGEGGNSIIHTGKHPDVLASLATSNPDDGYLAWITADADDDTKQKRNYPRSTFIATENDECKGLGLHWNIDLQKELIHIAVVAHIQSSHGWASIGFSETGGMRGADIVYFETSSPDKVVDAHVLDYVGKPERDASQDWTLNNHVITEDGYLIFEATRKLDTKDAFDRPFREANIFLANDHRIIGAWGSDEQLSYHGKDWVHAPIKLFQNPSDNKSFIEKMNERSDGAAELTTNNFMVPQQVTTYHDICFSIQELIKLGFYANEDSTTNVIGFEILLPETSKKYLHHANMRANRGDCGDPNNGNGRDIWGWAKLEDYWSYPSSAGMAFGKGTDKLSISINIHFHNPDIDGGIIDTGSGLRMYFKNEPIKYDMGMSAFLGYPGSVDIGEGLTRHDFSVPCLDNMQHDEITVVRTEMHMHAYGKRIVSQVIRDEKVVHEDYIDYYDIKQGRAFNQPQQSYTIRKGDKMRYSCYYDATPDIKFGKSSTDEMCNLFMISFPQDDYLEACHQTVYEGRTNITSGNQLGRVFGSYAELEPRGKGNEHITSNTAKSEYSEDVINEHSKEVKWVWVIVDILLSLAAASFILYVSKKKRIDDSRKGRYEEVECGYHISNRSPQSVQD